jgi:hypothetical protein
LSNQETTLKQTSTVPPKERRKRLLSVLWQIIRFSEEKRLLKGNSDKAKQSWTRICISAVEAYGSLLKTAENEEILERLEKLEKLSGNIL